MKLLNNTDLRLTFANWQRVGFFLEGNKFSEDGFTTKLQEYRDEN